jgi:PLP dependent protein
VLAAGELRQNLARVQERIVAAARRAGRAPEEITLIGVSKTQPAEAIRPLYEAGLQHFGENRVQEWEGKHGALADLDAKWHLIGHLQSNKAGRAAKLFDSVDSVDSIALAERLARARLEQGSGERLRVLIEVHLGGEETKSGVEPDKAAELAAGIAKLPQLEFRGLMCIPPLLEPEQVRGYFRQLRDLRDRVQHESGLELPVLSMGMSHDFEVAIEEGATEVRVGTALFGLRTRV